MATDPANLLVLFLGAGLAFFISRWIASRWKGRRRERSEQAQRERESRQVRRARERQKK